MTSEGSEYMGEKLIRKGGAPVGEEGASGRGSFHQAPGKASQRRPCVSEGEGGERGGSGAVLGRKHPSLWEGHVQWSTREHAHCLRRAGGRVAGAG